MPFLNPILFDSIFCLFSRSSMFIASAIYLRCSYYSTKIGRSTIFKVKESKLCIRFLLKTVLFTHDCI